jgi:hypothetical protein
MRNHYTEGGHLVSVDKNSPARILAKSEAWHPEDDGTDADLGPEDDGERIDFEGIKAVPRDALKTLLRFLIPSNSVSEAKRWRMAQLRVALMAQMLDVDGLGSKSFRELGEELGCTRALLSLYSLRMIDGLSIEKSRNGKKRSARSVYAASSTEAHRRAGHRMTADKAVEAAL